MSKVLPIEIQERPELNLRQGIKSSLNKWRELLSALFLFYKYCQDQSGEKNYCKEKQISGKVALTLDDDFSAWLDNNYSSISNIKELILKCPLYLAQMEHLQVGLELFLKLASVEFVNTSLADAVERTGGNRYAKKLHFSTNLKIVSEAILSYDDSTQKTFIASWLNGEDEGVVSQRVKKVLLPFTEECQFKMRTTNGELFFQQDGVYQGLQNPDNTVNSTDIHEPVGPFRILKSYVKEGMHPYIQDTSDGFKLKANAEDFAAYADMVQTTLSLIPKRTTVYQETESQNPDASSALPSKILQCITYGAPGTGKSFKIKNETSKQKVFRTTFHPDSDYATFVGAYKPAMKSVERTALIGDKLKMADVSSVGDAFKKEKVIAYEFVEQVFTKAYIQAWSYQKEAASGEDPKRVYLVIEEINRGNCAQVFGDLFQLLDRNPNGFSDYAIKPDEDFGLHIGEKIAAAPGTFDSARKDSINALYPEAEEGIDVVDEVMAGRLMLLPDNLYIRATMNTSDQSLFPMDSAFKRRWDWDYVAIKDHPEENWEIEIDATTHYSWWDFLDAINKEIFKATSAEDKQLGYYFVRTPGKKIDLNTFVNKVVFYLWNSVFKDCYTDCEFMKRDKDNYFTFTSFFKNGELDAEQAKAFLGKLKNLKSVEQKKAEESSAENSAGQAEASGEQAEAAS